MGAVDGGGGFRRREGGMERCTLAVVSVTAVDLMICQCNSVILKE